MNDALELTAQGIAERGRDALLERLRPAFKDAAAAHADVIQLDDEQIEDMVQRAADRADGLQWRRALAAVAVEELGIGLPEALGHAAVVRAQAILGAPSYEDAIAEIRSARASDDQPAGEQPPEGGGEPEGDGGGAAEADDVAAAEGDREEAIGTTRRRDPRVVTLRAVHLEGLKDLAADDDDLRLRFSGRGLELMRQSDGAMLMRLRWRDIHAIDLPHPRARLRRRHSGETRLVVLSDMGSATFEIPGVSTDEVRTRLAPIHRVR